MAKAAREVDLDRLPVIAASDRSANHDHGPSRAARATHEDMKLVRSYLNDDDLREALDHAPPGIIDPRSWAYWNSKLGRYPAPPMPKRRFG